MIKHLSYSSISNYLQCQRHWKHRYIDQLESEKSDALLFGSAWHKMINLVSGNDSFRGFETWEKALIETLEDSNLGTNDLSQDFLKLGVKMSTSIPIVNHIQGLNIIQSELKFEMTIPQCEVPIIGYIDAILANGTVVDFKTSKTRWNQDKVDNDLQATFYVAGLHSLGLIKADDFPVPFEYHIFLKQKKPDVQVLRTHRTAADCMALFNIIGDVWESMKNDTFLPSGVGSWKCSEKYCEFWNVCKGGMLG